LGLRPFDLAFLHFQAIALHSILEIGLIHHRAFGVYQLIYQLGVLVGL